MARDVRISAEAAAAIGPARAGAFAAGPDPGRYTCGSCRQQGDADFEPTSILVYRHPGGILSVVCAHAACCPSTVEDRDDFDASVLDQVRVIPVVLAGSARDRWAALVIQPRVPVELAVPAGPDETSAQVSGWLRDGLSLMGTAPGFPPPPADGWRVVLLADGAENLVRVTLLCRSGTPGGPAIVAEDMPILPGPDWLDIARARGTVPVYAGLTGLDRTPRKAPYEIARALAAASGRGLLAGGLAEDGDAEAIGMLDAMHEDFAARFRTAMATMRKMPYRNMPRDLPEPELKLVIPDADSTGPRGGSAV